MTQPNCELCGEPMPAGEEMFKFHGYSGPCPKPPREPREITPEMQDAQAKRLNESLDDLSQSIDTRMAELSELQRENASLRADLERERAAHAAEVARLAQERDAYKSDADLLNACRSGQPEDAAREEARQIIANEMADFAGLLYRSKNRELLKRADAAEAECATLREQVEAVRTWIAEIPIHWKIDRDDVLARLPTGAPRPQEQRGREADLT